MYDYFCPKINSVQAAHVDGFKLGLSHVFVIFLKVPRITPLKRFPLYPKTNYEMNSTDSLNFFFDFPLNDSSALFFV